MVHRSPGLGHIPPIHQVGQPPGLKAVVVQALLQGVVVGHPIFAISGIPDTVVVGVISGIVAVIVAHVTLEVGGRTSIPVAQFGGGEKGISRTTADINVKSIVVQRV